MLGTTPEEDPAFKRLEKAKSVQDVVLKANHSGYEHQFKFNLHASYEAIGADRTQISWNQAENVCFDGYLVELMNKTSKDLLRKELVGKSNQVHVFDDLEPCTEYLVRVTIYMGKTKDDEPVFVAKPGKYLKIKTLPTIDKPFTLSSLQADIRNDSIFVIWNQTELDQCITKGDINVSICKDYLARGTCFDFKLGEDISSIGDKYYFARFQHLQPCHDYQVSFKYKYYLFLCSLCFP